MPRGEKEYGAKGMRWVDSKIKDGKGGMVKMRTNKPEEKKAAPAPKPAPAKKAAPAKPKMTATAKASGTTGAGAKAKAGSARSGAARSTAGKVQEVPVPGRGIIRAIANAFSGKGETDAAKVASKGYYKKKTK